MRFQGLAVVIGKLRWPELIARQRKKDFGLDAYAPASLAPGGIGTGLAASITPSLKKISGDAEAAKENFPDLGRLLFVTSAKVGNADRRRWEETIRTKYEIELHIIEREEILTLMMIPENASLRASFLHLDVGIEPQVADLVARIRRAAEVVVQTWISRTKGHPLIDLTAKRLGPDGAESTDVLSLEQIYQALTESGRVVLEGPAGRGKTTTLIQLAQCERAPGTSFIVDLPAWTSSNQGLLEHIAGMPAFQAEGVTAADLARVQSTEPFRLLLNGWNEIAISSSGRATDMLRKVEREFPTAGIIVATRTHHLTPPLPGALRLRLMRLRRKQRAAYLDARLGSKSAELCAKIDADPALDELTRTPFILAEVASLFEAGAAIPSTKMGVLEQVLHLQEQRDEHRNALQSAPIFGLQTEYLKALAAEMIRNGGVALPEPDARAVSTVVLRGLLEQGQTEPVGAPTVLVALTAHHVLERVDYPKAAFLFEHQQLQEYYAAFDVRSCLLDLDDADQQASDRFLAEYVNNPAWAEPLRMIAETLAGKSGDGGLDRKSTGAGAHLVKMALAVDLVFAGELAQLCGAHVWGVVREVVGDRIRAVYATPDGSFREYALAAMLATGAADFGDIIVPLLSDPDPQIRLQTYRIWPDFQVTSLGPNWREEVRGWSEDARVDFVGELLHNRADVEIAAFAAQDQSGLVKKAAVSGLMWSGSDHALVSVLESIDAALFEEIALKNASELPAGLRPKVTAAIWSSLEHVIDPAARLRAAIALVELGEANVAVVIRDTVESLSGDEVRNLSSNILPSALDFMRPIDPAWTSGWMASQVAEGNCYDPEGWISYVTTIPQGLIERCLQRIETEDLSSVDFSGLVAVLAEGADTSIAVRVLENLRILQESIHAKSDTLQKLDWQVNRQLEAAFRSFPVEVAAAGILSFAKQGDVLDLEVVTGLLSSVARADVEPLHITDSDLRDGLRAYLKSGVDIVLCLDDFNGEAKADLASSLAQVGQAEDIADLLKLIHSDISRVRRGRAARLAGDHGPLANGGSMTYANWHIVAVMQLDADAADQVLVDLLAEPEYLSSVAAAMARDFLPKRAGSLGRALRYDIVRAAREGSIPPLVDSQRRSAFSAALKGLIAHLLEQSAGGQRSGDLTLLARALAAIDGRESAATVLDLIGTPSQWSQYASLEAAEFLLMAGVSLPATVVSALVESVVGRTGNWLQDSDRHLLASILALCPFVEPPEAGIAIARDALGKCRLRGHELRELVTALGESRSSVAVDLLCELASDESVLGQCEENFINAFAALDTPRAHELLLGSIDPDVQGIRVTRRHFREHVVIEQLAGLAQRKPDVRFRVRELCERDLPERNRQLLSRVIARLGTCEALTLNLSLIDDTKPSPVPQGVWDQFKSAFVLHRPDEHISDAFTMSASASNELRIRLFRMAHDDNKRRQSACMLLGRLEEWRLEHGRPVDEPRHPDFASGNQWPPSLS